jgi:cell division septation protein DedD
VKERLTGAAILVALIVLLVPELLSGPVRSAPRAGTAAAAAGEEPPLRSYTINLADDAHAHAAARAVPVEVPAPPAALPAPAPPASSAAAAVTAAPGSAAVDRPPSAPSARPTNATAAAPPGASASGASGAWMVQLGSFASRDNAERLAKQLRGSGFQASVSQGTTGRRFYRVRAGPVQDHAAAEQLAGKLRAAGHAGEVVAK